jgi:hypothetical protein
MSLAIFDAPTILPSASLTGETVSETAIKLKIRRDEVDMGIVLAIKLPFA